MQGRGAEGATARNAKEVWNSAPTRMSTQNYFTRVPPGVKAILETAATEGYPKRVLYENAIGAVYKRLQHVKSEPDVEAGKHRLISAILFAKRRWSWERVEPLCLTLGAEHNTQLVELRALGTAIKPRDVFLLGLHDILGRSDVLDAGLATQFPNLLKNPLIIPGRPGFPVGRSAPSLAQIPAGTRILVDASILVCATTAVECGIGPRPHLTSKSANDLLLGASKLREPIMIAQLELLRFPQYLRTLKARDSVLPSATQETLETAALSVLSSTLKIASVTGRALVNAVRDESKLPTEVTSTALGSNPVLQIACAEDLSREKLSIVTATSDFDHFSGRYNVFKPDDLHARV